MIKFESSSDLPKECPFCHRRLVLMAHHGLYEYPLVACIYCQVYASYNSPRLENDFGPFKKIGRIRTFFWRLKWLYYGYFRGAFA